MTSVYAQPVANQINVLEEAYAAAIDAGNQELATDYREQVMEARELLDNVLARPNDQSVQADARDFLDSSTDIHIISSFADDIPDVVQKAVETFQIVGKTHDIESRTAQDWVELMASDPDQFAADFATLSPTEQQATNLKIQQYNQQQNQIWSMLTAVSQAQHDTAKSIISNFRV